MGSVAAFVLTGSFVPSPFDVICVLSYMCFTQRRRLTRVLGRNAIMVVSRLSGPMLAVIGAQMVIDGITAVAGG